MKLIFDLSEKTHGPGPIKFSWQSSGNHLATTGYDNVVNIWDRHGQTIQEIQLPGACCGIVWDKDGDMLAIINNRSNVIFLWDVNSHRVSQLDSNVGMKDSLSFAVWSRSEPVLAVGSAKGNLLLYNHRTTKKVPVMGKHTKRITAGAFSDQDLVAMGGEDNQISISAIVGRKVLMLINLNEVQNPINLQFQARYGDLMSYRWFGDGYIMLGFEKGFLVSISTHASEIGQEIFSVQDHKNYLSTLLVSNSLGKVVTIGDTNIKMREVTNLPEIQSITNVESDTSLDALSVSDDGSLLSVSSTGGGLFVYLTRLPVLGDAWGTKIAALTSLTQITVMNETEAEHPITFEVEIEPTFVSVGPHHVAIGMNNRAWFYLIANQSAELIRDFEYLGSVQSVQLNSMYCAAMFEGKLHLHQIESNSPDEGQGRMFPDADKSSFKLTCAALTDEFLIMGTDGGHLQYFYLDEWKLVNEFRHVMGIKAVTPEAGGGTRLALLDERGSVFIYNPVNDSLLSLPSAPDVASTPSAVFWENAPSDKDMFVTHDSNYIYSYIHYRDTIKGPRIEYGGRSKLSYGHSPMMLYNSEVTCQTQSGRTATIRLDCVNFETNLQGLNSTALLDILSQCILLKKWALGWRVCEQLSEKEYWDKLARAALEHLEVDIGMKIFRHIGDVGMVWALEDIQGSEDRNLLAGHLAMYLNRFDEAEKLYLNSSAPIEALEMRRDLLDWDKALQLANRLAPTEIPFISKEYAQQLEFTGDYGNALQHYEQGIVENDEKMTEHNELCKGGIARMMLRTGDIRKGLEIAIESQNRQLKRECGMILESMKQFNEASLVYEKGAFYDRAAAVAIKGKNWARVGELAPKVHSPKIHAQHAKALEAEKKYKAAAEALRAAKDYDNLTRVLLDHLKNPDEAVKIVKESKSVEGAKLVGKFFLGLSDYGSAIQFLVISQCNAEAYKLAAEHNKMQIFADVLGDDGTTTEYEKMATYFETHKELYLAGKYYYLAGHHSKALSLLLANGEDQDSLRLAIDCVGAANDSDLTRQLMDFLIGEVDGVPKEAKYLFRLYMALRMYKEAAKTAVIIAREEQNNGQYRIARDVLFGMWQELRREGMKIPNEMESNLMLIHSYLLIKNLIKQGEHVQAARMLIRVANNISRFPSHTVQILTSAVIECSKVGLKKSAFEFSAILMRPDNRKKIDEKYKKKLEGRHLVKDDASSCPKCAFPALYSAVKKLAEMKEPCPLCGQLSTITDIQPITDLNSFLSAHMHNNANNAKAGEGSSKTENP